MGRWSVSETGLNYLMEYTNGFKRSIRRSQVTKTSQGATVTYASSQSPNLTLAEKIYYIQSYTSGTSTIDFTNNGGDDWNIDFKITPDTVQSTANIVGYHYDVEHWISGVVTVLDSGFKTNDYSYNAVGNGAGVYQIDQTYIFDDNSIFRVTSLYKVNSIGVVVAFVSENGVSVNNTNGLIINATAHYTEYGVSYPLIWASYDNLPPSSLNVLGNTTTINANVPIDSIGIGYFHALDSVFTDDYAGNTGSVASIVIS